MTHESHAPIVGSDEGTAREVSALRERDRPEQFIDVGLATQHPSAGHYAVPVTGDDAGRLSITEPFQVPLAQIWVVLQCLVPLVAIEKLNHQIVVDCGCLDVACPNPELADEQFAVDGLA